MKKQETKFVKLSKLKLKIKGLKGTLRKESVFEFVKKHPFFTLTGIVLLYVLALILVSKNGTKKEVEIARSIVKKVETYSIGSAPVAIFSGTVNKSGVITIVAQTPGMIGKIYKQNGVGFKKGERLLAINSNYVGGNMASVSREIAAKQYENTKNTFATQIDIIAKQRDLANKGEAQASELREIARTSQSEIRSLIDLNNSILKKIDIDLGILESNNIGGINDSSISSLKGNKSQLLSGNLQLTQGLKNSEYLNSNDKTPAQTGQLAKDLTLRQLELQEEGLKLGLDLSALQLKLAQISESSMYPSAPFSGVVERVLVKTGESVNPGTPIMILGQNQGKDPVTVTVLLSKEIAEKMSKYEKSKITTSSKLFEVMPSYVSREAVSGSLHAVYFVISDEDSAFFTQDSRVSVEIPIGYYKTGTNMVYIPVDSVYKTENESYVYVAKKGKAEIKKIEAGEVNGDLVHIKSGLENGDLVIVSRNVIDGDGIL